MNSRAARVFVRGLLAAALLVAVPRSDRAAGATGPVLSTPLSCWSVPTGFGPDEVQFPVSGTGFQPSSYLNVGYSLPWALQVQTDANGNFTTGIRGPDPPFTTSQRPQIVTVRAVTWPGGAPLASMNIPMVDRVAAIGPAYPHESPRRPVVWRVTGVPASMLYAHYFFTPEIWPISRRKRHYLGTVPLGQPNGPCGILTVKRRPFAHFRLAAGGWIIIVDDQRRYDPNHRPFAAACPQITQDVGGRLEYYGVECGVSRPPALTATKRGLTSTRVASARATADRRTSTPRRNA